LQLRHIFFTEADTFIGYSLQIPTAPTWREIRYERD
jgi:hypothetical protein